jgi:hypothetical protein
MVIDFAATFSRPSLEAGTALRDDAFEAKLAGVAKHGLAVALHVLVETNARPCLG